MEPLCTGSDFWTASLWCKMEQDLRAGGGDIWDALRGIVCWSRLHNREDIHEPHHLWKWENKNYLRFISASDPIWITDSRMWQVTAKGTVSWLHLCLIYKLQKPINNKHLKRITNLHNSSLVISEQKNKQACHSITQNSPVLKPLTLYLCYQWGLGQSYCYILSYWISWLEKTTVRLWLKRIDTRPVTCSKGLNRNTFTGWWGRCEKNYLRKKEGRKGGWRKKGSTSRPWGPWLEPGTCRVLSDGPPAARHGSCLDKQAFLCL